MRMVGISVLLLACITFSACSTRPSPRVVNVRGLGSNAGETKTLESAEEINCFTNLWFDRESFKKSPPNGWTHKIVIITEEGSGRTWLYNTHGYCALLTYKLRPGYRLKSPKKFNELIRSP